ncbi:MAG: CoA ester lyase [Proteobacteria bacterium]|nr:CoA ester lyase [Pseudomonadota bacterium]
MRSWLFVPGDSERKQARALGSGADALILDLEDSVDPAQLPAARTRVAALLKATAAAAPGPRLWVRVNALASGQLAQDLAVTCREVLPAGVMLPKVSSPAEVLEVAAQLGTLESRLGVTPGRTRLLVLATETAQGVLNLPRYPEALRGAPSVRARLAGLTWGMEDLGAALGALARRDAGGGLTFTFQLARTGCLLAAAALEVPAIDGVYADFRDPPGLARELLEARRDGFSGKLAIHPDQVAPINAAFTPTEAECVHARRVIAAFAAAPGTGVASLDGQMIDRPHLIQAQRVLARAAQETA